MFIIYNLLAILILLLIINIILTLKNVSNQQLTTSYQTLKDELVINRKESTDNAISLRTEIGLQLSRFTQASNLALEAIRKTIEDKLLNFANSIDINSLASRKELTYQIELLKTDLNLALKDYRDRLREQFADFDKNQALQYSGHVEKLKDIKQTLETSVASLQDNNEKKLEEMRATVDEKLQKTLETRLTQSFDLVSKNLESVQKGLNDMQQLATGVGDLKKVLSNVKTRGILGEIQLRNILEQMLSAEQYEVNVITKPGSANRVEFAIKIPQHKLDNKMLLMPVDSKFPIEAYYLLMAAYDENDLIKAEAAGKALEMAIKKAAKDIHDKYICPPATSEIGLLFLPIEGLYAEAVRRPALIETLQRDYQIIITGPTTLSAILNTISFGYKTMALEQRSGEIKQVLQAVKTEFKLFGDVLNAAQKKILTAHDDIDKLVGTRTRQIQRKLKDFDDLPITDANLLIGDSNTDYNEE